MSTTRTSRTATSRTDRLHFVPPAAGAYVGAWVAGLLVSSAQLAPDAPSDEVQARYVDHGGSVVLQALLVHAVAGFALAFLTLGLASLAQGRLRPAVSVSGLGAAGISLIQAVLAGVAVARASAQDAEWSRTMLTTINLADVMKLALLAVLTAAVTATLDRAAAGPRWLVVLGGALALTLVLGATSFLVPLGVLSMALVLSLVLLLVWVGSLGVVAARRQSTLRQRLERSSQ